MQCSAGRWRGYTAVCQTNKGLEDGAGVLGLPGCVFFAAGLCCAWSLPLDFPRLTVRLCLLPAVPSCLLQVRLPYLTSSFIGDVLLSVNWIRDALDTRQLLNAFQ